jgi:hypothetical protein
VLRQLLGSSALPACTPSTSPALTPGWPPTLTCPVCRPGLIDPRSSARVCSVSADGGVVSICAGRHAIVGTALGRGRARQ